MELGDAAAAAMEELPVEDAGAADAAEDAGAGGEGGEGGVVKEEEGGGEAAQIIDLERLRSVEGQTACPGCGKAMRKSQLMIHMRNKKCEEFVTRLDEALPSLPPITGRVKCPSCVHVSPNLKALRKHFASQHGDKRACGKCGKEYGRSDALRKHERLCGAWRARGAARGRAGVPLACVRAARIAALAWLGLAPPAPPPQRGLACGRPFRAGGQAAPRAGRRGAAAGGARRGGARAPRRVRIDPPRLRARATAPAPAAALRLRRPALPPGCLPLRPLAPPPRADARPRCPARRARSPACPAPPHAAPGEPADPSCACVCSPLEPYRSIFNLRAHIKRENENPKNTAGTHAQVAAPEAAPLMAAVEGEAAGGAEGGEEAGADAAGADAGAEGAADAAVEQAEGAVAAAVVPEAVM
jgi:hypothetical protein